MLLTRVTLSVLSRVSHAFPCITETLQGQKVVLLAGEQDQFILRVERLRIDSWLAELVPRKPQEVLATVWTL